MKRWFLALLALTFVAAGPALADCHPGHAAPGDGAKAQMAPCGQAPGCGAPAGCAQVQMAGCGSKPGCGAAAGCGAASMRCGSGCGHVSHDPNHIWFRSPAPKATLFGDQCGGKCDRHGMKAACGGKCGGPCGGPCVKGMKASCGAKCGDARMKATRAACGTPCGQPMMKATHDCCGAPMSSGCWHSSWKGPKPAPAACCSKG